MSPRNGRDERSVLGVGGSLDRIWPKYEAGFAYFGLNLFASFLNEVDVTIKDALKVWRWGISSIRVVAWDRTTVSHLGDIPFIPTSVVPELSPLIRVLENRFEDLWRLEEDHANFLWDPSLSPGQEIDSGNNDRLYRNLLGYFSVLPFPAPQAAKLSHCFRLPESQVNEFEGMWLLAAPIFTVPEGSVRKPSLVPADFRLLKDDRAVLWAYESVAGEPEMDAVVREWRIERMGRRSDGRFIDEKTQWIKNRIDKDDPSWHGANWGARLEVRTADFVDLPGLLVRAYRELRDDGGTVFRTLQTRAQTVLFFRGFLATLRDRADEGAGTDSSGSSLADDILDRCGGEKADRDAMRSALLDYRGAITLESWIALLVDTFPELSDSPILRSAVDESEALELEPITDGEAQDTANELDRVREIVASEANLRRLLLVQWEEAAAAATPEARRFLRTFSRKIETEILPRFGLQKRFARANLAPLWPRIVRAQQSPNGDVAGLTANLMDEMEAELPRRWSSGSDRRPLADVESSMDADVLQAFKERSKAAASDFAQGQLIAGRGGAAGSDDWEPTREPGGITVQLDRIHALEEEGSADLGDLLRKFTGAGVLMRQGGNGDYGPWRCLTLARMMMELPEWGAAAEIFSPALVPYRIPYSDGMRQSFLTYDNLPLIAASPTLGLAGDTRLGTELQEAGIDEILSYSLTKEGETAWAHLPGLAFGQAYQLAAFVIANSGALPAELVRGDQHPARFRSFTDGKVEIDDGCVHDIYYYRTVPIALPRLDVFDPTVRSDRGGFIRELEKVQLPRIPDSVSPLSRELELIGFCGAEAGWGRDFFLDEVSRRGRLTAPDGTTSFQLTLRRVMMDRLSGEQSFGIRFVQGDVDLLHLRVMRTEPNPGARTYALAVEGGNPDLGERTVASLLGFCDLHLRVVEESGTWHVEVSWHQGQEKAVDLAGKPVLPVSFDHAAPSLDEAYVSLVLGPNTDGALMVSPPSFSFDGGEAFVDGEEEPPLLLLGEVAPSIPGLDVERYRKFEFRLRRPAVDLLTWDRWKARDQWDGDSGVREWRRDVWASFHRNAPRPGNDSRNERDLTMDDPAVADFVVAELVPLFCDPPPGVCVVEADLPTEPWPEENGSTESMGWRRVQLPGLPVVCRIGDVGAPTAIVWNAGSGRLEVTIRRGDVAELLVYPTVLREELVGFREGGVEGLGFRRSRAGGENRSRETARSTSFWNLSDSVSRG